MACVSDAFLDAEALGAVLADVAEVVRATDEAGGRLDAAGEDGGGLLSAGSFWCPRGGAEAPRNAIERAVGALVRANETCECAGAEWWVQDVGPGEPPKVFHTDCALSMSQHGTTVSHPTLSTVLYLSDAGGPTVVFDQTKPPERPGTLEPALPRGALACPPVMNRLLAFPGDRVHCVLHDLAPRTDQRLTLLINLWPTRPDGVAELPPRFFSHRLASASASAARAPVAVPSAPVASDWAAHSGAWRAQTAPPPLRAVLLSKGVAHVRYDHGAPPDAGAHVGSQAFWYE